ncbi:MAG: pyridoxal phosphate-dependent aminotransferase [Planctomycetota bacterium]
MKISKRAELVPPSPIRKFVPFADAAKAAGKKVYHLNIGQPDVKTPLPIWNAIRLFNEEVLEYGHSKGLPSLREAVVKYYSGYGHKLTSEDVAVTTGGSEAILFAYTAVADPGDEIIVFEPFYANYNGFARMLGINLVPVTLKSENGFALPSSETILAKITPRTRAFQICSPNNPTGKILTLPEMETLVAIAKEKGLFIISDEVYREFAYDDSPVSILSFSGFDENAIVVDSISKRFSACGARVGMLISKNAEVMNSVLKFGQARLCPPTIDQVGAVAAYEMGSSYFKPVREEYRRRRDVCVSALCKIDGVVCPNPGGAFYIMAKLPVDDSERFTKFLLTDFSMNGETVMVAPGSGFYFTEGCGTNEVRIAYVLEVEKLARAMTILKSAIATYNS